MEELLNAFRYAFPKWMKWFALVVGVLLVGDGMRSLSTRSLWGRPGLCLRFDKRSSSRRKG